MLPANSQKARQTRPRRRQRLKALDQYLVITRSGICNSRIYGRFPDLKIIARGSLPNLTVSDIIAACSLITVTRSRRTYTCFPFTLQPYRNMWRHRISPIKLLVLMNTKDYHSTIPASLQAFLFKIIIFTKMSEYGFDFLWRIAPRLLRRCGDNKDWILRGEHGMAAQSLCPCNRYLDDLRRDTALPESRNRFVERF